MKVKLSKLFLIILTVTCFAYLRILLLRSDHENSEVNTTSWFDLDFADRVASVFMKSSKFLIECDILSSVEFVAVTDEVAKDGSVWYGIRVNDKEILERFGVEGKDLICNAEGFDKLTNHTKENGIQTLYAGSQFDRYSDFKVIFYEHGFYRINCAISDTNRTSLIYEDAIQIFPLNMSKLTEERHVSTKSDGKMMNVLMIRVGQMSYPHLRRIMPLTFDYLSSRLEDNLIFTNGNSIGANAEHNLMPLFSGILAEDAESLNLSSEIEKHIQMDDGYYDRLPFIWYEYEKLGYLTAFQEDDTNTGPFNHKAKGFRFKPTAFYGRPYWLERSISKRNSTTGSKCKHGQKTYKAFFRIIESFLKRMHNFEHNSRIPYFFMNSITKYTLDHFLLPEEFDQDFLDLLQRFENSGYFENTLLVIYSDTGQQSVSYSVKTDIGKQERYFPFLSVKLPKRLQGSSYSSRLSSNKNKLISFFDLHQTLRHFLNITAAYPDSVNDTQFSVNDKSVRHLRGISLFENIPADRSCADAFIDDKYCLSIQMSIIDEHQFKNETRLGFSAIVSYIIDSINNKTANLRDKCSPYQLQRVHHVRTVGTDAKLYQFILICNPDEVWFEAFIRIENQKYFFKNDITLLTDKTKCSSDELAQNYYCHCKI